MISAPDPRGAARPAPAPAREPEWPGDRFPVVKVRSGAIRDRFWVDPAALERMRRWSAEKEGLT